MYTYSYSSSSTSLSLPYNLKYSDFKKSTFTKLDFEALTATSGCCSDRWAVVGPWKVMQMCLDIPRRPRNFFFLADLQIMVLGRCHREEIDQDVVP